MTKKKTKFPRWAPIFFAALERSPNVKAAAEQAGVTKQAVYLYRKDHPDFGEAWEDAIDSGIQRLEAAAFERAIDQSDTLAIFLLKCHRPEKYRDPVYHNHQGGINCRVEFVDSVPGSDD